MSVVEFRDLQREGIYRLHRDMGPSVNLGFLLLAFISQENDWHFLFCVLIFSAWAAFSDLFFSLQRKADRSCLSLPEIPSFREPHRK